MYRLLQLIKNNKTIVKYGIIGVMILIFVIAIFSIISYFSSDDAEHRQIVLENTPIEIESVRPKGEIYVCSSIIEDYTTYQKTEKHLGIISEEHSCVQIMRQKCSYKIDLDKIEYKLDTLNRYFVKLPNLEYVASTQNSPFMSDDEEFWIKELPNTNGLKKKVASQIKGRFDTKENREKGGLFAKSAISALLSKLGYEAIFVDDIEQASKYNR